MDALSSNPEEKIKLINIIDEKFKRPVFTDGHKVTRTIEEVFLKLQSIYPSTDYSIADVASVLDHLEYESFESTTKRTLWLVEF